MDYLLDTHTLIWFLNGSNEISTHAKKVIESNEGINYVSVATILEITIKVSLGKLEMKLTLEELETQLSDNGFQLLPMLFTHFIALKYLPFKHRDPFDRFLVAQANTEGFTIIGKDPLIALYNVASLW